ncbi:MAG: phosphatidate cytidylyltransferase [Candidatus Methylacidiphilales bacterium]|nr:phosphatidate cytidylyltransferase [Candidatus Methylacidiphilales bacterium]
MLAKRIFSSALLIGLLFYLSHSGHYWGVCILVAVTGLLAQWEFYTLQESKGLKVFKKAGVFCGAVYLLVCSLPSLPMAQAGTWWGGADTLAILLVIIGLLSRQVFETNQASPMATVALTLFGFFYIPFLFSFIIKILFQAGYPPSQGVLLAAYVVAVTKATDIGAFIVGTTLGRHKMSPTISPKKTWEGFVGGLVLALVVSLALSRLFDPISPVFHSFHPWCLGVLLSLISVVGDLAESVIKRDARIKDSGGIIPGIGGCLDLIDSILFTAPLFFSYLLFFIIP